MEDQRFKTMRHIETVRNYLNLFIKEFLNREELHDQSKLQSPEREAFDIYTPLLKNSTYGSKEYKDILEKMKPAVDHHYKNNRHHPEYFNNPLYTLNMNLIDLIEMLCDWKAATLRHADGNIYESLKINVKRFRIPPELKVILKNTIDWIELNQEKVFDYAEES